MRLFSNSNGVHLPYAPIFDGRLLLGMSLFSKKYSISFSHSNTFTSMAPPKTQKWREGKILMMLDLFLTK